MPHQVKPSDDEFLNCVSFVVAAYCGNNPVALADLPAVISSVRDALALVRSPVKEANTPGPDGPAVPVRRSITPESIRCLDCGKSFKTLRRHLMSAHGLSPEQYRARWNLPSTYSLVAPNYSDLRSTLAKDGGLGRGVPAPVKRRRRR